MPMFNSFPQQLPYGLDQPGADPQLPADSPLERLSRLILSGKLPDEMRPHVARVLQGIRQDIADQASTSGYGGAGSRLAAPAADPPSLPSWGSLAPSAANDGAGPGSVVVAARRKPNDAECEGQYKTDIFQCKMVGLPQCYAQAMERYAACQAGRPIPPFNY